jgi:hypothetical protein
LVLKGTDDPMIGRVKGNIMFTEGDHTYSVDAEMGISGYGYEIHNGMNEIKESKVSYLSFKASAGITLQADQIGGFEELVYQK